MKKITKAAVRTVLIAMGFTVVLAVPGWAQFELNPDHYESKAVEAAPQPQMALPVQNNEAGARAILGLQAGQRPAELRLAAAPDNSRAVQQQNPVKFREGGLSATLHRAAGYLGPKLNRWATLVAEIE